ncbi:PREDICTED: uncharacterized protein LOC108367777 [Rhagoletis zephyria]|uniref:uncharacterized protein LOC108367777 n=1 Tax=Rhagoletis zephyria TaxID=28612 RepID=UPI0008114E26|nr:PREDICTED: uncharacterized protein LOC108367777 [Rhagoletis zephyria]
MSEENIEAYFYSLEFWFEASLISSDVRKFNIVLASVPPKKLMELKPIIETAPPNGKYAYIREKLIDNFTDSQQRRLQRVVKDMALGDRRPSDIYKEMKRVAGNTLSDSIIHDLWLRRLPPYVQAAAIAANVAVAEKLKIADLIIESIDLHNNLVHSISSNGEVANFRQEVTELTRNMQKLLKVKARSRSRLKSCTVHVRGTSNGETSWYHKKFGDNATKCREPCSYKNSSKCNKSP